MTGEDFCLIIKTGEIYYYEKVNKFKLLAAAIIVIIHIWWEILWIL